MNGTINWWLSKKVRQARQMCSHARKLINEQRDLLSPAAKDAMDASVAKLDKLTCGKLDPKGVEQGMNDLESTATRWLRPYPFASYRENVEVFLVAICVAMGIRTFFIQPFKIPTGSMQPTLFGVTSVENHANDPNFKVPIAPLRWFEFMTAGASYFAEVARNDGAFSLIDERPSRLLLFNFRQRYRVGPDVYSLWFPPDEFFRRHAGIPEGMQFKKGQDIFKLRAVSGDHLFVDRMTYNFRPPKRGEIVVFQTVGIRYPGMTEDQYYIKRLVGLPGETLQIGADRHLVVDGKRLDQSTPHFERIYDESKWKQDGNQEGYVGHVYGMEMFRTPNSTFKVPERQYAVMGDNTLNSQDSRYWGGFQMENVIGQSFMVYWPFNTRWGWWGHR
ncbi:MAG: signal peptidase I [Verrucomicrobia bacterium]|nr:signal peptidase I [Verrucomicrobiota bacterium]